MKKGKIIVIDGIDGSGKETQTKLIVDKLSRDGVKNMLISFPRYDNPSSCLVKMYLNGEFGSNPKDVNAYAASSFYALDRYAAYKQDYGEFYNNGGIIITDRYTTSNMVHQAAKIKEIDEKNKYLEWLIQFEYEILGIPKPDKVFFLNMPYEFSIKLMKERKNKMTQDNKKDIQESSEEHLKDAYNNACNIAIKYGWNEINCVEEDKLRSIENINEELYQEIKKYI